VSDGPDRRLVIDVGEQAADRRAAECETRHVEAGPAEPDALARVEGHHPHGWSAVDAPGQRSVSSSPRSIGQNAEHALEFVVRLISVGSPAGERLGVLSDGHWMPAADLLRGGPATITDLLHGDPRDIDALRVAASHVRIPDVGQALATEDLLAPLPRPGKIVAIGRNYREHAAEEGVEPPVAPLVFAKWPSAVIGPGADIRWDPALTGQVDYEAELAVVIGRRARRVSTTDALDHVLGYTCLNDVSARDLQLGDGQWVRGKSLDSFCPMGPAIVTADEIADPQNLAIRCLVNDEVLQEANTSEMYFTVAEIVSHCSQAFTLEPGDVIATGTPSGVGAFRSPPRFLADGDRVVVEIDGIGRLENVCRLETAEVTA
jgi:2-keto-4-pentenoate hydratase/2-oxohepta-3-ene-1,7-dioic acid hydratase in catechol pathway